MLTRLAALHPKTMTMHRQMFLSRLVKRITNAASNGQIRLRRAVNRYRTGRQNASDKGLFDKTKPMTSIATGVTQRPKLSQNCSNGSLSFQPVAIMTSIAITERFMGFHMSFA